MFYLTDNPFKGKVPDDKVKRYWDMFGVGVSPGYTDYHQGQAIHMADSRIH